MDVHKVFIEDKAYKSYMWDTFVEMNKYYELLRRGKCSLSPTPLQTRPRGSTFCCKKKERKKDDYDVAIGMKYGVSSWSKSSCNPNTGGSLSAF